MRENLVLADTAYTALVITQVLTDGQETYLAWVMGSVIVYSGYLLLRLRTYLNTEDKFYFKVRVSSSDDECEEDDQDDLQHNFKSKPNLKSKMNNIYLSMTIPFIRTKSKLLPNGQD